MKILFSGYHNPNFITITEYIEEAIRKLGYQLISFDDRKFIIPGRLRKKFYFLHTLDLKRINGNLTKIARKEKPEIYIETGGYQIFPASIRAIKKMGIKTGLWTIDPIREDDPRLKIEFAYDFVFCGGTEMVEVLKGKEIENGPFWLPFACDPDFHKRVEVNQEERKKYGSDICFVGSFYPNRAEILEKITDFNLKVWGPGWNNLSFDSPLKKLAKESQLKPEEWRKIYSSSKIILAIHYQDGKIPCYQASPKVYEALACKSFLLVDNQKDVKSLFEDGKHLTIFKDIKDLREKIKYYLIHPEERERIAQEGYREVIQKHTYLHRIKKMLTVIGKKIFESA
ncbi:MAG: hypothetical protein COS11_04820 [bacterium (Candidatus Ratteibacteria) CG01_land_8_20_14_3_00_40_19]|uniref:Spore protein YkvP/CgeB glycosyl transferase-like domain-containing protein n=3 Tax=Candidatus Ratteibacteria TaxID=2979319 RepID=A0A2M7E894_9BACT|nr:MAG: hypothetical protein COS11_04820 [bacterium (Candidatus Ratteibacteria) CG01_land_8_20_14_3_00_40_19]